MARLGEISTIRAGEAANGYAGAHAGRRDPMTALEVRDVLLWRARRYPNGGGWQATAAFAGRSEHDVRINCDPDYARQHGKSARELQDAERRRAALSANEAAAAAATPSTDLRRGLRSGSNSWRVLVALAAAGNWVVQADIIKATGMRARDVGGALNFLAASHRADAEGGDAAGRGVRYRATAAGKAEIAGRADG